MKLVIDLNVSTNIKKYDYNIEILKKKSKMLAKQYIFYN